LQPLADEKEQNAGILGAGSTQLMAAATDDWQRLLIRPTTNPTMIISCLLVCLLTPPCPKKKALGWFFVSSGKNVDFLLLLLWNKRDLYTSTKIKGSCCTKWRHGCWRGVTAASLQGYLSVVCGRAHWGVGPTWRQPAAPTAEEHNLVYSLVSTTSSISGL